MKSLRHNLQNTHNWERFVYQDAPDNQDFDFYEKTQEELLETGPRSDQETGDIQERMQANVEGRNHQKTINEMIEHMESEGIKEKPEKFSSVPASEILSRSEEDLRTLFLSKENVVEFHGNESVRQYVGAGDLISKEQGFIKIDGVIGKRSISNGKVGYLDRSGNYLPIFGGEKINLEVSEDEQKGFESVQEFSIENEGTAKTEFKERVKGDEKALEEMKEEMRESLRDQGLTDSDIDNLSAEQMFGKVGKLLAQKVEEQYGIPWQVCLAQSSLESNYGKRALGKNFFGIKAQKGYLKEVQTFTTHEYENGIKVPKKGEMFRKYNSIAESFNDYGRFLKQNSRYRPAFAHKDNPRKFLEGIIGAGYATTPVDKYVSGAESRLNKLGYSLDQA